MQPTTTNGDRKSAGEMLDSLRHAIEKLEAENARQRVEIEQLRAERDEYRTVIYDHLKKRFGDSKAWDDFDEKDFTLKLDDLIAVIRSS